MGSTPTRSRHLHLVTLLLPALVAWPGGLRAQEPEVADSIAEVGSPPADSVLSPAPGPESTPAAPGEPIGPPVTPMGAFLRSLILPGWGQASVDQPVRGAFYFTMEAASLWMLYKTDQKLAAAERAGDDELAASRREQKEDWIVMAVFWALFSGVDAWVSTHLWSFEGAVIPPPDGSPGVAIQYSVPVGGP